MFRSRRYSKSSYYKKAEESCSVLIDNRFHGILPIDQLNDDIYLASTDFEQLKIDDVVTCIILAIVRDSIVLTKRKSFILNRTRIIRSSTAVATGTVSYGFVKSVTESGSIIGFLSNSSGIIRDLELRVGDTVSIKVVSKSPSLILNLCHNKKFEISYIDNYDESIKSTFCPSNFRGIKYS